MILKIIKIIKILVIVSTITIVPAENIPAQSNSDNAQTEQSARAALTKERGAVIETSCNLYKIIQIIVAMMAVMSMIFASAGFFWGKPQFAWIGGICVNLMLLSVMAALVTYLAFGGGTKICLGTEFIDITPQRNIECERQAPGGYAGCQQQIR